MNLKDGWYLILGWIVVDLWLNIVAYFAIFILLKVMEDEPVEEQAMEVR